MSEFKEKVLSEISFAMVDDAPDLQKLYDKVAATDEHPQLNDNQQIVLEWLEEYYAKSQWPFPFYVLKQAAKDMPANIFGFYDDFTMKEEFEVLAAFAQWGLEQEDVE